MLKFFAWLLLAVALVGCMFSPAYWATNKALNISYYDKDNPIAAQKGWEDGCKGAMIHWKLPGQIRAFNEFNIDPYYASDPLYRDAWTYATYYCMANLNSATGAFLEPVKYLDATGDSIVMSK